MMKEIWSLVKLAISIALLLITGLGPVAKGQDIMKGEFWRQQVLNDLLGPWKTHAYDQRYEIKRNSYVTLNLYDSNGKLITTLEQGQMTSGSYEFRMNREFKSGIHYYQLKTIDQRATRKMLIQK